MTIFIGEAAGKAEVPETCGRKNWVSAGLSEIENLTSETIEHRGSKGSVSYTYAPTLWLRGGPGGDQKLADWSDKMRAQALTDWLRQRLNFVQALLFASHHLLLEHVDYQTGASGRT